jgi:hypothetical protein
MMGMKELLTSDVARKPDIGREWQGDANDPGCVKTRRRI